MQQATGANARLTFREEAIFGTADLPGQFTQLSAATAGVALKANVEKLVSNALSPKRGVRNARGGNIGVSGSIPFEAPIEGIAKLMKHALGIATTVDNLDGTFTHTIKRGALPAGLTFEVGYRDINLYQLFEGVRIDKMSLSVGTQGIVTGSMDVTGTEMTQDVVSVDANPIVPDHTPFVHHEATISGVGGALETLNFSLDISNDLDAVRVVGKRYVSDIREGRGEAGGSLTLLLKDRTYIDAVLNETESTLVVDFTNTMGQFKITLPRVKLFGDAGAGIATDKGLVLAVEYSAIFDPLSNTDVELTFINSEPSI